MGCISIIQQFTKKQGIAKKKTSFMTKMPKFEIKRLWRFFDVERIDGIKMCKKICGIKYMHDKKYVIKNIG